MSDYVGLHVVPQSLFVDIETDDLVFSAKWLFKVIQALSGLE